MKVQKRRIFYDIAVILQYCWNKTIARSGDMCEDVSDVYILVMKCFGTTNTSIQKFPVRIPSGKTASKCLRKLTVFSTKFINKCHLYWCVHLCNSHMSQILNKFCDILPNPSFCTFTCNEALYSVVQYIFRSSSVEIRNNRVSTIKPNDKVFLFN